MKRLTDKKAKLRIMLQSLPVTLAAIVFIMYASTFAPRSAGEMERSIALVESVSYYQICAGGKPVVWFKSLGDSCTPEGMTLKADTAATTKRYATGCWVNRYPLFPSCPGLLLTANADSTAWENVAAANKDIRRTLAKAAKRIDGTINQLKRKIEETDYYMKVHNVNDDGYNIMAVLAEDIKRQKAEAEKLAATLKTAAESEQAEIRIVTRHTLICRNDTAERPVRKPCVTLTKTMTSPVTLLQTADKRKTAGALPVYLHRWLTPPNTEGRSVIIASIPGCGQYGFTPDVASPETFDGTTGGGSSHDLPPLLAPDGSAVFTKGGFFTGISIAGRITSTADFGFGLNKLQP